MQRISQLDNVLGPPTLSAVSIEGTWAPTTVVGRSSSTWMVTMAFAASTCSGNPKLRVDVYRLVLAPYSRYAICETDGGADTASLLQRASGCNVGQLLRRLLFVTLERGHREDLTLPAGSGVAGVRSTHDPARFMRTSVLLLARKSIGNDGRTPPIPYECSRLGAGYAVVYGCKQRKNE